MANPNSLYLSTGHFVQMPIVLQIVLKPKELAVFNTIQHMANLQQRFISYSMFVMYTGFDHKTIGSALKSLTSLRLISKGSTCKDGTHYEINAQRLNKVVIRLNKTLNPIDRLKLADSFRGAGNELHAKIITNYSDSSFNNNKHQI